MPTGGRVKCAVCSRKAKGYGWFNPRLPRSDPTLLGPLGVLLARCQDAFSPADGKDGGHMIDPSDMELAAMRVLPGAAG
jgi:hypothetical protein